MKTERLSGVLLHPTSLPCSEGIGTIGKQAYDFIDWLESAKQRIWQILPIGPTGYGDSPYASFSTFAGNPLLIDIPSLIENTILTKEEATEPEWITKSGNVDFGSVVWWKIPLLKKAAEHYVSIIQNRPDSFSFKDAAYSEKNFRAFCSEMTWLNEYSLFMSIKEFYDAKAQEEKIHGAMWNTYWPKKLASRDAQALEEWKKAHIQEIENHKVIQFFFFTQWKKLKAYANSKHIEIVGDIPIFVASDSSDVWADQNLFQLNKNGTPKFVAGVPPDYFSATGQLWGNPLYNWNTMKKDGYAWWIKRIKAMLSIVDYVRIDHFRGFEAYWSIPFGSETAIHGEWKKGPGSALFKAVKKELGSIPIIAEDLGIITDEVAALRDEFNLPGMKVLQFAFSAEEMQKGAMINAFLPHEYIENCVVYPGTHDNDTARGWFSKLSDADKELIISYLTSDIEGLTITEENLPLIFIQQAFSSIAQFAVFPLQDIYALGSEARMNEPSTAGGTNWQWRMSEDMLYGKNAEAKAQLLKKMSIMYDRNTQRE
jgi:4-alpha-glucanotransferase